MKTQDHILKNSFQGPFEDTQTLAVHDKDEKALRKGGKKNGITLVGANGPHELLKLNCQNPVWWVCFLNTFCDFFNLYVEDGLVKKKSPFQIPQTNQQCSSKG